jgi:zinc transport system substrate-binding protein
MVTIKKGEHPLRLLTVVLLFSMLVAGCSPEGSETSDEQGSQINIYTSIYPLQFFAERIAGKHAEVKSIIPPGADGHTYEPTTKELIQIAESDMLIYNGAGFEGFIEKAKKSLKGQDVQFVNASENLPEGEEFHEGVDDEEHNEDEHGHGKVDPHFWLDPTLAIQMSETIKAEMLKQRPELKEEIESNFATLRQDLEELDQQFKNVVESSERKEFIVAHSAYGKWEERYGLKQISISGLSPSHEPSQKEAQEIIDYARTHNVRYIIFEKNFTSDIAEMIRKEVDAEVLYLSNLESLTEEQHENDENYFTIMQDNIGTLKKVLN